MSKWSGLPCFLSLPVSVSQRAHVSIPVLLLTSREDLYRVKRPLTSLPQMDVKGQMHIKALQMNKCLVKGLREETNLVTTCLTIVSKRCHYVFFIHLFWQILMTLRDTNDSHAYMCIAIRKCAENTFCFFQI